VTLLRTFKKIASCVLIVAALGIALFLEIVFIAPRFGF
jgi:hypothetical protein